MKDVLDGIAYSLGVQSFKNNKKRVPAWDKELLEICLKDCQVGEGPPYIKSWLLGWDHANLGIHKEPK